MKKLFTLFAAIVAAVAMNATVLYTLDTSLEANKGDGNSYFDYHSATVNGITWSAEGNTQMCPWRIGGKGDVVRHAKTTTAFAQPVASIQLTLGTANCTLNSVKFMHSTSADFAGAQEITVNIAASSSAIITVEGGFPANSYFQFIFDQSCSTSSNQYVQFSKVEFLDNVPVLEEPDTISATIGEIIAMQAQELNTDDYFHTTGVISSIENTTYGNLHIADGADTVMVYGTNNFAALNLAVGDTIEVIGKMKLYQTTLEFVNVDVLDVKHPGQGDKVKLEFTSGSADIYGSLIDILLEGDNISVLYETSFSNKSIAGTYTDAKEENIVLTIDAAEYLEMPVTEGTFKIAFVSVDESSNYTYTATINLKGVDGITYTGETTFTVNGDLENDNNNIDVAMAIQLCIEAGQTATTELYNVYGYVASIKTAWDAGYKNSTFYMSDDATATKGDFLAYRAKSDAAIPVGSFVKLNMTNLINYSGNTPETNNLPVAEIVDPANIPVLRHGQVIVPDTIPATVAEALLVGNALAQGATTTDCYEIEAYVITAYDPDSVSGEQTWYMADDAQEASKDNEIMIQFTKADQVVAKGDKVKVIGKIMHYYNASSSKEYICIRNASAEVIEHTGVQELIQSAKSSKALLNGKLVIIKNGKAYNAQGMKL